MIYIILILALVYIIFFFIYKEYQINKANKRLLDIKKYRKSFQEAVEEFKFFMAGSEYFNKKKYTTWNKKFGYLTKKINFNLKKTTTEQDLKELILKYLNYKSNGRQIIDKYNENFIIKESERISQLLKKLNIENNSDQRRAIVCEEDNTLVIAGAGTGKTQTILGKVAYLYRMKNIKPEEILLLSFTKKAEQELKNRVYKINKRFNISTFNGIGYSIIGKASGYKPSVAFGNDKDFVKLINDEINSKLQSSSHFLSLATNYFLYYLYPIILVPGYETKDEYYKSLKTGNIFTIKRERVKSIQEAMIANFLYSHKINYKYEEFYKHKTIDKDYAQYKPDFYLSDYDVYLEHFGIDRNRKTHFTKDEEQNKRDSVKYAKDMKIKRNFHSQYKTKLIETYSYEFFEGDWQEKLTEKLTQNRVKLEKRNDDEILEEIRKSEYVRLISLLMRTFINLIKSGDYSLDTIKNKFKTNKDARGIAFMQIFEPIFKAYHDYLKEKNLIDFNDMLLIAADYVSKEKFIHSYKYIIIDEFQDFSFSKLKLIKAMMAQNSQTRLFCVGDDWQSIFRFSGADVNLMFNFEKYLGFTKTLKLEECHRFSNQLAEISNNFILKNDHQLKKRLFSDSQIRVAPLQIIYKDSKNDSVPLKNILEAINNFAQKNDKIIKKVLLLGRFHHNRPVGIKDWRYSNIENIEFLTIHKAKGLTCDFAIILNNETGKYGFPSNIADDPLINSVLSEIDPSEHSEERRLMYVAMTRARFQVFLIVDKKNKSSFIFELEKNNEEGEKIKRCFECKGEMVVRLSKYGKFYGCSNFPDCRYTEEIYSQNEDVNYDTIDKKNIEIELSFAGRSSSKNLVF